MYFLLTEHKLKSETKTYLDSIHSDSTASLKPMTAT